MPTPQNLIALGAVAAAAAATLAGPAAAQPGYDRPYADRPAADQPYGSDRGYGDRSTDDRGYDNRAYDNRAYGDRGYGDRGYGGRGYEDRAGGLVGAGVPLLLPELRDTPRGRAFVRRDFDFNGDGVVQPREARAANRAFQDRRGFGPDAYVEPPPPPPATYGGGYDRPAMHAYGFRQNQYGAVFTLQDVLFETGSARLRPTADAKLRPLAGYLRQNPGQRLRIDGYTDSVGTAQANLILSRDRARSVADALAGMGIDAGRFQLEGHGEDSPAASNATAEGRQLNRRVEVTLLGRQASSF